MFKYDEDHSESIIGCKLVSFNQSSNAADIFKTDQLCKDMNLLWNNVKEFAGLNDWKPTTKNKRCIRCSCCKKPDENGHTFLMLCIMS